MELVERIKKLCQERGITLNQLEKAICGALGAENMIATRKYICSPESRFDNKMATEMATASGAIDRQNEKNPGLQYRRPGLKS